MACSRYRPIPFAAEARPFTEMNTTPLIDVLLVLLIMMILTVPVVTQISNHLATTGGSFSGTELVTLMAGANDVFINLAIIGPTVAALTAFPYNLTLEAATNQASTSAVTAMGTAGAELAAYTKALIVGKGAKYVAVLNMPDVSKTPFAYSQDAATQALINTMVVTFNTQLQSGLAGTAGVIIVDAYSDLRAMAANPSSYLLTNVTAPACNLTSPSPNALGSSLVCTVGDAAAVPTVVSNVNTGDISHYLFADSVHPSPYGYKLTAQLVTKSLKSVGWL